MGQENPFRFSTKCTDNETGIVMYQLRPYHPSMGRWLSRDPIQEDGGLNILAFVNNGPTVRWDSFGLYPNKAQAATPRQIVHALNQAIINEKRRSGSQNCNDWNVSRVFNDAADIVTEGPRYVYLLEYGWVDFRHFFAAARWGKVGTTFTAEVLGFGNEVAQWLDGEPSAWSYEDIPSNRAGGYFGQAQMFVSCCDLSAALMKWLQENHAFTPNQVPSKYNPLPDRDDGRPATRPPGVNGPAS